MKKLTYNITNFVISLIYWGMVLKFIYFKEDTEYIRYLDEYVLQRLVQRGYLRLIIPVVIYILVGFISICISSKIFEKLTCKNIVYTIAILIAGPLYSITLALFLYT